MNEKDPQNFLQQKFVEVCEKTADSFETIVDVLRFEFGDPFLAQTLSCLNQEFVAIVPVANLSQAVSSEDPGTMSLPDTIDSKESDPMTVAAKLSSRMTELKNLFRQILELGREVLLPAACEQVEQLKRQVALLETAVMTTVQGTQVFADVQLCVLLGMPDDRAVTPEERLTSLVRKLVATRVGMIQLRDKRLNDRELVNAGKTVMRSTSGTPTRLIINDRPDIVLAVDADGVHLGQDDLDVGTARKILGAAKLIGVSTHSIQQARQAVLDGANYIGVGPVFPSQTKSFDSHVGLDLARQVAAEIRLPAFAIGGIDLESVDDIVEAGLSRVAVSAAIANAKDPAHVARQLKEKLASAGKAPG